MKIQVTDSRIIAPHLDIQDGVYELKKWSNKTSDKQRRYYWGCLIKAISDYSGYTEQETHEKMKEIHLRVTDKGSPYNRSTQDLNTKEREEYHEDVRRWGSTVLGLYLPLPREYLDMEQ